MDAIREPMPLVGRRGPTPKPGHSNPGFPAQPAPHQLLSLQVLRAVAALFVTIAHASEEAKHFFGFEPIIETDPFGKGVDLFFVISGFIIYHASEKLFSRANAARIFITNRIIRIVPLYFIFTTLMVLAVVLIPSGVKEATFDVAQIVTSYFFIPYERHDGRIAPILSLGWTLNYEMFFYVIFSLCLLLKPKHIAAASISCIIVLALIGTLVPETAPSAIRAWTHNIILEFAAGIAIAYVYGKNSGERVGSSILATLLLLLGFILLYFLNLPIKPFDLPRFISAGLPATMIVASSVLLLPTRMERILPRWMVALGDSSYSLYLSHRFIQRPLQILISHSPIGRLEAAGSIYLILAVTAACIGGHIIYLLVERPLLRRMKSSTFAHKLAGTPS